MTGYLSPTEVRRLLLNPELGRQLRKARDLELLHQCLKERGFKIT